MSSYSPSLHFSLGVLVLLVFVVRPTKAFGAGNIASVSSIEGQNWRHGDIEDTLLNLLIAQAAGGRKFSKLDVKRIYFGNWLRDYSQAVDVGTVKSVSAEAIRILLWILGFLSFGYGTHEFEVTTERLGCYRPEEHIDNPLGYPSDAQNYDRRLRGPIDEDREISVNPETGLKNYIASEDLGITTSAGLIRQLFGKCIELGRQYAQSQNDADLHEALRLLGTGCHCLEDFSAHSNFVELALIELGERDVFPHVGQHTEIELPGARRPVYPLITGTFGGVDFLHSVVGEISDKAVQSEIQELEGTMQQSQANKQSSSMLHDILKQLPSGLLGGGNQSAKMDELEQNAQAAQMQSMDISPREPEAWTRQLQETTKQIYPVLEWHDHIMKSINEAIEKIPVLPDLIEQFQEQLNIFVFSLIAPFVMPIIGQIKTELVTGSSVIIKTSKREQLNVFHDDRCSDPTHSMLSKDHFSNVLNEPAGRIASQILKWVVPQMMEAWDDEGVDVEDTLTRIIYGVFHHPALRHDGPDGAAECRQQMFNVVEQWWDAKDEGERHVLREQLSRDGVEHGRNHREGVHDSGHGCGKPLGMPTYQTASGSGARGGAAGRSKRREPADEIAAGVGDMAGKAAGGGALGGMVSGIIGGVGASLLGGAFGGGDEKKKYSKKESHEDGSYTQTRVEAGHHNKEHDDDREYYAQAQYSKTSYPGGGGREEYQRYEQPASGARSGGHGYQEVHTARPSRGGGYEETAETRRLQPGGGWETEQRREGHSGRDDDRYGSQDRYQQTSAYGTAGYESRPKDSDSENDDDDDDEKKREKQRKREKKERKRREKEHKKMYGGGGDDDDDDDDSDSDDKHGKRYGSSDRYRGSSPKRDHGESRNEYGSSGYGSRGYGEESREYSDTSRSRLESSGYREGGDSRYGSSGYGGVDRHEGAYGRGDNERASGYGGTGSSGYGTSSGYGDTGSSGYGARSGYAGGDSSTQFERGGSGYGGSSGYGAGSGYSGGDSGQYERGGSGYGGGGGGGGGEYGRSSGFGENIGYGQEGNEYGGGGGGGGGYGQEGQGGYDARRRGYGDGGY